MLFQSQPGAQSGGYHEDCGSKLGFVGTFLIKTAITVVPGILGYYSDIGQLPLYKTLLP